jgi:small conductance mechanosensitive channel
MTELAEALTTIDQVRTTAVDLALRFGPKLLVAITIFAIGVAVSRWAGLWLGRFLARIELEPPVRTLLMRIGRVVVLVLFLIMALQNLGIELLPLLAGLGVIGAGAALAMQGLLSDVAAGLSIIFSKPFRVGEYISIVGEEGVVGNITVFNTVLAHPDGSQVVIPNRKMVGEILHNYGKVLHLDLTVGVAYDVDLERATATVHDLLRANPRVLHEPPPLVQPTRLADSCIEIGIKVGVATENSFVARGEINKAIVESFRKHGIAIPFPQREVHVLGDALLRDALNESGERSGRMAG